MNKDFRVQYCLPLLERVCNCSQITYIKTIRLSATMVKKLLEREPSIKVVYYVRDPRGMLVSRASVSQQLWRLENKQYISTSSLNLCNILRYDVKGMAELHEKFPRQILRLRYEDMATDVSQTVDALYRFIGREVPESIWSWAKDNTRTEEDNGKFGTLRNSSKVANRWRSQLPAASNDAIVKHCSDVLQYLNYTP